MCYFSPLGPYGILWHLVAITASLGSTTWPQCKVDILRCVLQSERLSWDSPEIVGKSCHRHIVMTVLKTCQDSTSLLVRLWESFLELLFSCFSSMTWWNAVIPSSWRSWNADFCIDFGLSVQVLNFGPDLSFKGLSAFYRAAKAWRSATGKNVEGFHDFCHLGICEVPFARQIQ